MSRRRPLVLICVLSIFATTGIAACGSSGKNAGKSRPKTVVLMTHDSFAVSPAVLAAFTRETGYKVKVLKSGDAGETLSKAILVVNHPVADALFGVDNTFLTRAFGAGLFEPYEAKGLANIAPRFVADAKHRVTPIDNGAVCLNYDRAWFGRDGHPPAPTSLADLVRPEYKDLTVVEDPAKSSPGLAFLLATIDAYGSNGWKGYWRDLRANGVRVVSGWEQAYNADFTGGGGHGDRPIVVSYGSSPPADVVYSEPHRETSRVGVVTASCFDQTEFAGVLHAAGNPEGARALIDFMLTRRFQEDMPLQMYVYPVIAGAALPPVFARWAVVPAHPHTMSPRVIGANRNAWIQEWSRIVLQ